MTRSFTFAGLSPPRLCIHQAQSALESPHGTTAPDNQALTVQRGVRTWDSSSLSIRVTPLGLRSKLAPMFCRFQQ